MGCEARAREGNLYFLCDSCAISDVGLCSIPVRARGECPTEREELIDQLASLSPGLSVHVRNGLVTIAVLLAEVAAGAMALAAEFGNGSGVAQSLSFFEVLASLDAID
jgi:hypothetical protein